MSLEKPIGVQEFEAPKISRQSTREGSGFIECIFFYLNGYWVLKTELARYHVQTRRNIYAK
jgi:hypothetical protein